MIPSSFVRVFFLLCMLTMQTAILAGCNGPDSEYVIVTVVDSADRGALIKNLNDERIRFEAMPDGALKVYIASAEELKARTPAYQKWLDDRYHSADLEAPN